MSATSTKNAIGTIYALGHKLGIVDRNHPRDDGLHQLVSGLTGKDSVKALTGDEQETVVRELRRRVNLNPPKSTREYPERPGKMSAGQQRKVWALMYSLQQASPSEISLGKRLAGIIKKDFKISATGKDPLIWLSFEDGNRLIEALKKYIRSAKRKAGVDDG